MKEEHNCLLVMIPSLPVVPEQSLRLLGSQWSFIAAGRKWGWRGQQHTHTDSASNRRATSSPASQISAAALFFSPPSPAASLFRDIDHGIAQPLRPQPRPAPAVHCPVHPHAPIASHCPRARRASLFTWLAGFPASCSLVSQRPPLSASHASTAAAKRILTPAFLRLPIEFRRYVARTHPS
jgi:hypothetical protein